MLNQNVQELYEAWPYPEPIDSIDDLLKTTRILGDPSNIEDALSFWGFVPEDSLRILVAGCGTFQAAALAYLNPEAYVVGIDISHTSLNRTQSLKEKHKLLNLELHRMSVLDCRNLSTKFHLIVSTGVIHHLDSPLDGLKELTEVLADDGVIHLMLYGQTGRVGVYMVQELLRKLGVKEPSKNNIERVRNLLEILPRNHPAHLYKERAVHDLKYDGAIVDTFLHPKDTAFRVSDLPVLAAQAGLVFRGFLDNGPYCLEHYLPSTFFETFPEIHQLSFLDRAVIADLCSFGIGTHRVVLARRHSLNVELEHVDSPSFSQLFPTKRRTLRVKQVMNIQTGSRAVFGREKFPDFSPAAFGTLLLDKASGLISVADILTTICDEFNASYDDLWDGCRDFYIDMWRRGHILFRIASPHQNVR